MPDHGSLSARNPKIQQLRRLLGRRSARLESGNFVVEGPTLVAEVLASDLVVEEVYLAEAATSATGGPPDRAWAGIEESARGRGVEVRQVAAGVLEKVGSTVTPQPVMAVVRRRAEAVGDALVRADGRPVLVLAGVSDPGNAGTLLRSAEASGSGAVVFADGAVDPFNPKVVRASAGSLFRVPIVAEHPTGVVLSELRAAGYRVLGTAAQAGAPGDELDLTRPTAIVLGNEAHGMPDDLAVDELVTIPTEGAVESLNVAMAGTLLCFEAARQRRSSVDRPDSETS